MKDVISVIVPVYNVESYIRKCIESIINQTYKELEIILVNDGSTDQSGVICDEYMEKDSRIVVIHKKNGGVSDSRNVGLSVANGNYITFVDSDDYIHPKMFELLLKELKKNQADISIGKEKKFFENNEIDFEDDVQANSYKVVINTYEEVLSHFLDASEPPFTYAATKLYKKEVIDGVRFVYGKKCEDLIFIVTIAKNIRRAVWVEKELYYYRQRSTSIIHTMNGELINDYCYAIRFEYDHVKDLLDEDFKEALLCKCLNRLAVFWVRANDKRFNKERRNIRESFIKLYNEEYDIIKNRKEKLKLILFRYFPYIYMLLKKERMHE